MDQPKPNWVQQTVYEDFETTFVGQSFIRLFFIDLPCEHLSGTARNACHHMSGLYTIFDCLPRAWRWWFDFGIFPFSSSGEVHKFTCKTRPHAKSFKRTKQGWAMHSYYPWYFSIRGCFNGLVFLGKSSPETMGFPPFNGTLIHCDLRTEGRPFAARVLHEANVDEDDIRWAVAAKPKRWLTINRGLS